MAATVHSSTQRSTSAGRNLTRRSTATNGKRWCRRPSDSQHVVPWSSLQDAGEDEAALALAKEAVTRAENVRLAHQHCNTRKGKKRLNELALPFAPPPSYDQDRVVASRARYEAIWNIWRECYDLAGKAYVVCGDVEVVNQRHILKEEINQTLLRASHRGSD
ncbi:MAG: hypothetical protein ACYC90_06790 [Candidatus Nanopelagicales bacterium]